jgi:hypothetical protein
MPKDRLSQLTLALRKKMLMRFTRPLEPGWVKGYVLGIGARCLLVALVSDDIWLNGFQCFRLADVREVQVPDEYTSFIEAALAKRKQRTPKKPPVKLDTLEELLLTANRAFPLITIHREKVDPDVCEIGRVTGVSKSHVSLIEIDAAAEWAKKSKEYRLSEITRVDFGGEYEDALHIVGGPPNTPSS